MTRGAVISMALLAIIVVALLVWVRRKFPAAIRRYDPSECHNVLKIGSDAIRCFNTRALTLG